MLLMGDFNLRELNWADCSASVGKDRIATQFLECVHDNYFFQCVKEFKRIRYNNEPSVPDLLFINEEI